MPYYTYESLVNKDLRFEIKQSIHDAPLEYHPESGEPIKKTITAAAIRLSGLKRSAVVNKLSPAATACGCASNAALAASVLRNSSVTPSYNGQKNNQLKNKKSHHYNSHGKSGHCSSGHN
ncbi:MAG: hypothetical protein MAG581_00970 [Deltaproteobacteria bacterium]|jgi:hypothetical protein|nr:hypothetical protein [Deltaproteobacteria bacterium]